MRVAIVHDYLTQRGGAERVVLSMLKAFPEADLYTLLYDPASTYPAFKQLRITTSPLNSVSLLRKHHRVALPLLPLAASWMKVDADVVLCSSSGWAHGVRTSGAKVVYCYSPARWLYDSERYLGAQSDLHLRRLVLGLLRRPLVAWDKRAAAQADNYLSISSVVRQRIQRTYGRSSVVVPAPQTVDTEAPMTAVRVNGRELQSGYYLCVSRLLPYKRVGIVVDAFQEGDRRLVVVGRGPELDQLRARASTNVTFLSDMTDAQLHWLYRGCRAVVSASYEDFGLTPLEAAAFGRPSVVPRDGGFLDTVIPGQTGILFEEVTSSAISSALTDLEGRTWDPERLRDQARAYSEERFVERLRAAVEPFLTQAGTFR